MDSSGKCVKVTPPPPDSTINPPDSTIAPPDSTIPPDSTVTPPDSTLPPGDVKYKATVSSAGTGAKGGGEYPLYAMVSITAGTPPSGKQFKEWTSSVADLIFVPNNSSPNAMFSMPASAVTVTANFEAIPVAPKYTVTVSSAGTGATGGGEYSQNDTVTVTAGTPPTGQQFKGWVSSVTGVTFTPSANNATVKFIMPASAVTVTANFEPIPAVARTITFSAGNGAMVSPTSRATDTNGRLASLPTPTKSGYDFVGWFTTAEAEGGTKVVAGDTGTVFKADAVVYARWTLAKYTITYTLNGGTVAAATPNPISYTVETDTFKLHNPTQKGYKFTGWTEAGNTTKMDTTVTVAKGSTGDKSYTANWLVESYKITYVLDGGTVAATTPNLTSYTVVTETFTLNNPTKKGYTFNGWTEMAGVTPLLNVSVSTGSTGDKTYTANWTIITYTITYDLKGGTEAVPPNPTSYTIETATILLNKPTKTGYTFVGWTGSNGSESQTSVDITKGSTGDKEYVANWTTYTLTLVSNPKAGGDAVVDDTKGGIMPGLTAGTKVNITAKANEGYTFTNWTITSGNGEISSTNNESAAVIVNGDVTVTANFTKIPD
jgi:uncharacterized repeat protein (TIGR02543 family)